MFYKTKQVPDVRPEVSVKKLVPLQYKLLESAYKACKPGGLIVYSTCTLNPYENEMNVARFLEAYAGKVELEETGIAGVSP
jgi:16S rRNA C967 or C1407 C5-methylase (RsmB/RsmF family)